MFQITLAPGPSKLTADPGVKARSIPGQKFQSRCMHYAVGPVKRDVVALNTV